MISIGPAVKVVIHVNDDVSSRKRLLYEDILKFLFDRGVASATLLRVQSGFGTYHSMRTLGFAGTEGGSLQVRIEFIETRETVEALLPALYELITDGVIEAQDTTILKAAIRSSETP
jgi:PII-like signaling protein